MLSEVLNYAHRTGITAEPGFSVKNAKWGIEINSAGKIYGIEQLGDAKVGKQFKKAPDLSQGEMIAGSITRSQFLVDSLNVVALFYKADSRDKDIQKFTAKHQYFISLLEQAAQNCPELAYAAQALKDAEQLQKLQHFIESLQPKPKPTDTVTLMIDDEYPLESENWHDWWRNFRQQLHNASTKDVKKESKVMRCLLTGELIQPVETHPKIKGLSSVGGLGTGDVMIGFDKDAFQSYGLKKSLNAAMDEATAKNYAETFNHLLAEQSESLGKQTKKINGIKRLVNSYAVYWFGHFLENDDEDPFLELEKPTVPTHADETRPKQLLNAIKQGERPKLLTNHYYCLIVSGQAGRVMIRDFQQGQMEDLIKAVAKWFEHLKIIHRDGHKFATPPKFLAIVGSLVRDLKDAPAPLINALWKSALNASYTIPYNAFSMALLETRKAVINEEAPNHARMGLLKAFHIRNLGDNTVTEKLNPEHKEPAYHCGRLLSVLADLQYAALGDVGSGVIQRYYTATSQTPALRFGQLMANAKNHLAKLEKPKAMGFERKIADIMSKMEFIPRTLDLEKQSLFALGYYQQMAQKHSDIDAYKMKKLTEENNSTQGKD